MSPDGPPCCAGPASLVVLEVQQRQAVAALRGGQVKAAVELLEAGRTAKQALLLPSSPARATGLEALTEAYAAQGRVDDALACWEEAARIQVRSIAGGGGDRARRCLDKEQRIHTVAWCTLLGAPHSAAPWRGSKRADREREQGRTDFQNF